MVLQQQLLIAKDDQVRHDAAVGLEEHRLQARTVVVAQLLQQVKQGSTGRYTDRFFGNARRAAQNVVVSYL